MFSAIHKRFTYSNVAMTLALVFAMSGGAYAAGKYLITSTKQISPKVLKSLVGKTGPAGKNGTNGANGANGAPGEKGAQGSQGPQGPEGKEGKAGEPGKEGKAGTNGTTGFTETLPSEKTETGAWTASSGASIGSISFPIPLAKALDGKHVHFVERTGKEQAVFIYEPTASPPKIEWKAEPTSDCPGNAAEPAAAPGNLCVYETNNQQAAKVGAFLAEGAITPPSDTDVPNAALAPGAGVSGAVVTFVPESAEAYTWGSWAVTAE